MTTRVRRTGRSRRGRCFNIVNDRVSGIRSRRDGRGPRLLFEYGIAVTVERRPDTMARRCLSEWSGTERNVDNGHDSDDDDNEFCLNDNDGVSRVLSHYNARDTHDCTYLRGLQAGHGPLWPVENGPSIDSLAPGYLHVENGWLH
ncbi:uncharacterized protein LOC116854090 [Odontomachus brunneus]|uniref:uncharacterized protein LOC116854090 n=1 Tax=Odontomachus brunneus TaxID=486640 RepID=UPI0013F19EF9|nr:uncharacterized protein LOC116854090 [Odontomachus brunneus]